MGRGGWGGAWEKPQFRRPTQSLELGGAGLVQPRAFHPAGPPSVPPSSNPRPHWWRPAARPLLFFEYIRRWRWQLLLKASPTGGRSPRPYTPPHPPRFPLLPRSGPVALPPFLPFPPGPAPYLVLSSCARPLWVARSSGHPSLGSAAMELPQPDPASPGSAPSPARVHGGTKRPGLRLGAHGLLGFPERATASSPVTTLTQTMHDLAGLGR